jgi:hypothetical protein
MLMLARMMRPVLEPSNIYAHRHEEQDVILWYNRALWHSIVSCSLVQLFKGSNSDPRPSFPSPMAPELCINAILQLLITRLRQEKCRCSGTD